MLTARQSFATERSSQSTHRLPRNLSRLSPAAGALRGRTDQGGDASGTEAGATRVKRPLLNVVPRAADNRSTHQQEREALETALAGVQEAITLLPIGSTWEPALVRIHGCLAQAAGRRALRLAQRDAVEDRLEESLLRVGSGSGQAFH
jgi:hypothetical protein